MDGSRWREREKISAWLRWNAIWEQRQQTNIKVKITEQQIGSKNDSFVEKNASRFIHSKNA